jgi:hypothetical protein
MWWTHTTPKSRAGSASVLGADTRWIQQHDCLWHSCHSVRGRWHNCSGRTRCLSHQTAFEMSCGAVVQTRHVNDSTTFESSATMESWSMVMHSMIPRSTSHMAHLSVCKAPKFGAFSERVPSFRSLLFFLTTSLFTLHLHSSPLSLFPWWRSTGYRRSSQFQWMAVRYRLAVVLHTALRSHTVNSCAQMWILTFEKVLILPERESFVDLSGPNSRVRNCVKWYVLFRDSFNSIYTQCTFLNWFSWIYKWHVFCGPDIITQSRLLIHHCTWFSFMNDFSKSFDSFNVYHVFIRDLLKPILWFVFIFSR